MDYYSLSYISIAVIALLSCCSNDVSANLVATNSSTYFQQQHVRGRSLKSDQEWMDETGMKFSEGPYIVNGDAANTAQTRFFVHFGNGICGGSLIAPNRVLTAAHCVRNAGDRPS
jgi:hypothetical protein